MEFEMRNLKDLDKPSNLDCVSGFKFILYMRILEDVEHFAVRVTNTLISMNEEILKTKKIPEQYLNDKVFMDLHKHHFEDGKLKDSSIEFYEKQLAFHKQEHESNVEVNSFKAICDEFKAGLVQKYNIDGNFKKSYYVAVLDDNDFARSFLQYMQAMKDAVDFDEKHKYTNWDLMKIKNEFRKCAGLVQALNIRDTSSLYSTYLIPMLARDRTYKTKKEYMKQFGLVFKDDKFVKYLNRFLKAKNERIETLIKNSTDRLAKIVGADDE